MNLGDLWWLRRLGWPSQPRDRRRRQATGSCVHCHEPECGRLRVVVGSGRFLLCASCEARMQAMGYEIIEERRRG